MTTRELIKAFLDSESMDNKVAIEIFYRNNDDMTLYTKTIATRRIRLSYLSGVKDDRDHITIEGKEIEECFDIPFY